MTIEYGEFRIERTFAAPPARVWNAWADPAIKRRWFVESDGPEWGTRDFSVDFHVGGMETGSFELAEGPGAGVHRNVTHYLDIVPERRIAFAYTMAHDGRIHSASLATVEFEGVEGGTRMTFVEHGAFFEGSDGVDMRRGGWEHLTKALEHTLAETKD